MHGTYAQIRTVDGLTALPQSVRRVTPHNHSPTGMRFDTQTTCNPDNGP